MDEQKIFPRKPVEFPDALREKLIATGVFNKGHDVWINSGFVCEYCDTPLLASLDSFHSGTGDHILPSCKYGNKDRPATYNPKLCCDRTNLALACSVCNYLKRGFDPGEGEAIYSDLSTQSLSASQRQSLVKRVRDRIEVIRQKKKENFDRVLAIFREYGIDPLPIKSRA